MADLKRLCQTLDVREDATIKVATSGRSLETASEAAYRRTENVLLIY